MIHPPFPCARRAPGDSPTRRAVGKSPWPVRPLGPFAASGRNPAAPSGRIDIQALSPCGRVRSAEGAEGEGSAAQAAASRRTPLPTLSRKGGGQNAQCALAPPSRACVIGVYFIKLPVGRERGR
jgi:hypothetical protein